LRETLQTIFSPRNEFFLLADDAKRLPSIWISSLLLPIVFVFLAGLITQFLLAPLYFGDPSEASTFARQAFGLYVMFGVVIILIALWMWLFEGRAFYKVGFTKDKIISRYLFGFGTGVGMNFAVVGLIALFGNVEFESGGTQAVGVAAIGSVTIMLFGFVIQGASEEILARGWMMQVIGARYKPWIGALISSIIFALLHLGNSGISVIAIINLVLFALLMVLYVLKDGSIWSACAWHSSWNWTLGNVLGLSVSGTGEKVSLINLKTSGHELVTGGGFGPEGSLITSIVLLVAIILVGAIVLRNNKKLPPEETIEELETIDDSLEDSEINQ
jgi:membrane protease YdiL (CAAX protease family)